MRNLRFSIITPCLNASRYIAETVESVLAEGRRDLEYLVIDGGSTDGTLGILRGYADRITLVSGRDAGQSDAINKGLALARGEIVSWINASDRYMPGSFAAVDRHFDSHPETGLLFGRAVYLSAGGQVTGNYPSAPPADMAALNDLPGAHYRKLLVERSGWIPQQTAFWRRSLVATAGFLDTELHYAMDYEYWLRLGRITRIIFIDETLGAFRLHPDAKSASAWRQWREVLIVNRRYGGPLFSPIHAAFLRATMRSGGKRMRRLFRG